MANTNKRETLVPVDLQDMREEEVYLAVYEKWPGLIRGHFPFRVKTIKPHCAHILFEYPVRKVCGFERLKGDEPAIFRQSQKTKAWTHHSANVRNASIKVFKVEGKRLAKFREDQEYRKKFSQTPTKFSLNSYQIKEIEKFIDEQARAEMEE
jgi:hypothetical protein